MLWFLGWVIRVYHPVILKPSPVRVQMKTLAQNIDTSVTYEASFSEHKKTESDVD
jgi:hypothetical protein